MSSEAAGASLFYSGSGRYLSPLERKRLRAIQNELPKTEQQEPSKRVTRTRTLKPQSSAKQASKKRKRSAASTSSGVASARPKKRTRVPSTPPPEKKERKAPVIPFSVGAPSPPPPSDENSDSAPPTAKVRKFFSSGLRNRMGGGGTSAASTAVFWGKKFTLQFRPAVAPMKKPAVFTKKDVVMTVPYRLHPNQVKTDPVPDVNLAASELKLAGTPQTGNASKTGVAAQLEKKQREVGNQSTAVVSSCIEDEEIPGGLGKVQNDTVSDTLVRVTSWLRKVGSAGAVSNISPRMSDGLKKKDTHLDRCVTDPWDEFGDRHTVESDGQSGRNARRELFISDLGAQPEHKFDLATPDTISLASSVNGDMSERSATPDTISRASSVNGDMSERPATPDTISRASSVNGDMSERSATPDTISRASSMNGDMSERPATPDAISRASSVNGDMSGHSSALQDHSCVSSASPSAESSQAVDRPETPPASRSRSAEKKALYPIFSTPSSTRERTAQRRIPTSPIGMPKKKFIAAASDPSQLIIDAGQKKFGHTMCSTCGMVYAVGDVDDEKLHMKHHQSFLAVVKFGGWKNQREVGLYPDGKIIMVSHSDPKVMLKKMEEIQQMVDRELGIVENASAERVPHVFFVFVSYTKKVLGFLAAREIKRGYRVIPDDSGRVTNSYCCESSPVPAICGVSRIWTAPSYRRKKVASRLLDRMRLNFSFGCPIGLDQIAFSDPTLVGRELAASYTKNDRFLVFGP